MAVAVEHDKRKHEILEKALDLFTEDGYDDVTYQKIADRSGITRTTLYIYFKNKREIFTYCIKQFTDELENQIAVPAENEDVNAAECLRKIMYKILDILKDRRQLLNIIADYLMAQQKSGVDVRKKLARRLLRVGHWINVTAIRGIKNNEIRECSLKDLNRLLSSIYEGAVLRLTIFGEENIDDLYGAVDVCIDSIKK